MGDVEIIPLWNGNGTVKVVIINADKQPASEELIEDVKNYIDENRPIGATVTVTTPEPVPVNISVKIIGGNFDEQKIKDNIAEYFGTLSFKTSEVSITRIGKAILDTADNIDYEADSLKINNSTENIPLTIEQIAILGEVIISHD